MPDEPSSATTVFLYADTFALTAEPAQKGTRSFATGAVVQTKALGQMMLAVSLQHLHATGAVRLESHTKKTLGLFGSTGVHVTQLGDLEARGADERLTRIIARNRKARNGGVSVASVVAEAVPRSPNPYGEVIQWGIDEAVELGYLDSERTVGAVEPGKPSNLVPRPERIVILRGRVDELAAGWGTFRAADGELARQLRLSIGKAIAQRGERRDSDDLDLTAAS
jgi:hypothetical protein